MNAIQKDKFNRSLFRKRTRNFNWRRITNTGKRVAYKNNFTNTIIAVIREDFKNTFKYDVDVNNRTLQDFKTKKDALTYARAYMLNN